MSVVLRAGISFRSGVKRTYSVCALHVVVGDDAAVNRGNQCRWKKRLADKQRNQKPVHPVLQVKATGYLQGCLTSLWE